MVYTELRLGAESFDQCRYDGSKLLLRGPRRDLNGDYVACLGGTETFARFVARPYPDLLEEALGVTCVNFGWPNAGIDVFRSDAALMDCASRARLCVLQVPNAINLSNMYYRVHPRRNDRVLEATDAMRALFPRVDFTEFSFTRHMLTRLRARYPEEFLYLCKELRSVWTAGMEDMLGRIDAPVVLLWLSLRRPEEHLDRPDLGADPGLVDRDMLSRLRPLVSDIVEVSFSNAVDRKGVEPIETALGSDAHVDTAAALQSVLSTHLQT